MMRLLMWKVLFALVAFAAAVSADTPQAAAPTFAPRAYIGLRVVGDIPDLLRKHLQIPAEQGVVVQNVFSNSPADKAGLDKGDILLEMDGQPLSGPGDFYRRLRRYAVGSSVSLTVIRTGKKFQQPIVLEPMADDFRTNYAGWKYPLEPQESVAIRPSRVFQLPPGQTQWIELPLRDGKNLSDAPAMLAPEYHFLHSDDQSAFTVIIEGDPEHPETVVRVKSDQREYFTTVSQVQTLPPEFRAAAQADIPKAQKAAQRNSSFRLPMRLDASSIAQGWPFGEPFENPYRLLQTVLKRLETIENRQMEIEKILKERSASSE